MSSSNPAKHRQTAKHSLAGGNWLERFKQAALKVVATVGNALVGLAICATIFNALALITGRAASLNNFLASDDIEHIFVGQPGAYSEMRPEVLLNVLTKFYLPTIILGATCSIVLGLLILYGVIKALSALGHVSVNLIASRFGEYDISYRQVIVFVIWTVCILSIWAVLNIDTTLNYLLAGIGLMLVDLALCQLAQSYFIASDQSKEPNEPANTHRGA